MRALEVGDDPAVQAADELERDLDVPRRDPAVDRDLEVALGAADDEPMIADADDLAVRLAVVKHGQHGDRRADRRAKKGRRGPLVGRRRGARDAASGGLCGWPGP